MSGGLTFHLEERGFATTSLKALKKVTREITKSSSQVEF